MGALALGSSESPVVNSIPCWRTNSLRANPFEPKSERGVARPSAENRARPSRPIQVVITAQIPAGQTGSKELRSQAEYQFEGSPNPTSIFASPNPLVAVSFRLEARRFGDLAGVILKGETGATYQIEYSDALNPPSWKPAGSLMLQGAEGTWVDTASSGKPVRFYRAAQP